MSADAALRAEGYAIGNRSAVPASGVGLYSPQATLAALEGLLQAHAPLPGRKALLLFSSPRFRFPEAESDKLERSLRAVLDLAQPGFSIWTVDVEGLDGGGNSELLSSLAGDSGGKALRNIGDLAQAFEGAGEQLSCYYLFSLPLQAGTGATRHTLRVSLDTERFKELWGLRVMSPSRVAIESQAAQLTRRRVAALLSPDDFARPPVTATLDFPTVRQGKEVLFARFRVPLSELTWIPLPSGGVTTRLLVDAVVQRDSGTGLEPVCEIGAESLGELELRLPRPPPGSSRAGLTIELPCAFRKDGIHVARGVVTDLEAGSAGAGRSTVVFSRGGREEWAAMAARVEAASGLDLVWRPGLDAAKKETGRSAFRVVSEERPADPGDRVSLSYVLCGPQRSEAARKVRHLLVGTGAGGEETLVPLSPGALLLAEAEGPASFCSQVRVTIPEYTLGEGRYLFAIVDAAADPGLLSQALRASPATRPDGLLGSVSFRVSP